ncbi:extracellular solute-binding protein [Lacrimispora indolis]|uniref:extracellular solute-binding protein n=1 Tax=Lacrimispora indolis TaxID=69825 RepID=UPI0003FD1FB9|nr:MULTISPECIES: extracellular solute-binding protein [Lachnospiraceae]MBE7719222.1 extracellular solute-binding protein [Lacrimispora celerecrescens]
MRRGKKWMAALGAAALVMAALSGCGSSTATQTTAGSQAAQETQESKETSGGETTAAATEETKNVNDDGTVNNPEQVAVDSNKLVMWSLFSGGDGGFMNKMIEEYNGTSPTKQVQSIMLVWADYYTKLQTAVAAGKGPDIGISHASSLPQLVEDGVVQPITSYLDELGIDLSQHYSKASIDAVTFDGEVYAIPLDTHAEIMYFNKGILEQAGVTLNAEGAVDIKNVDEFYAVCDKIKAVIPEDGSTIAITNNGDDPYRLWWATYFQMGGTPIVSEDGKEVTLDKEKAVKAAEFVKGLYDKGYIKEGIDDHQKFFQSGKAGICIGGTWAVGAFEQTDNLSFVPMAFPKLFDTDNCWADSHTFILPTKKARNEADSKAAVEFMAAASMKGGVTWASSGQIPACKEVLASDDYKALPYRSSYMSEVEKAVLPAKVSTFNGMKKGMIDSLDTIWTGKGDAASGIDALYDELESNLP